MPLGSSPSSTLAILFNLSLSSCCHFSGAFKNQLVSRKYLFFYAQLGRLRRPKENISSLVLAKTKRLLALHATRVISIFLKLFLI